MAETPYTPPPVTNRAPKPPGILPRHAQSWVLGGIALVMVLVIAFSGGQRPKEKTARPATVSVTAADDVRIRDYRERIDQQMKKLAAAQALQDRGDRSPSAAPTAPASGAGSSSAPGPASFPAASPSVDREKNWIARDREKREYESRYASNVALSHRSAPKAFAPEPLRDIADASSAPDGSTERGTTQKVSADLQQADGKMYRLFEGTIIETTLTNRLDGSFSGPINCLVTTNVYSHDRMQLLIPQGTRVLGTVSRVETQGQQRLAVAFHRLIMPDGYSVSLDKLPGLSQQGETGLLDQINHHYMQVFGVSLAIGAIAGLSQANTQYGANATAAATYRQGVASSLSQTSLNILDRYLNVLPTFTVREGHRIKVYLTGDISVPAYDHHRLAGDL